MQKSNRPHRYTAMFDDEEELNVQQLQLHHLLSPPPSQQQIYQNNKTKITNDRSKTTRIPHTPQTSFSPNSTQATSVLPPQNRTVSTLRPSSSPPHFHHTEVEDYIDQQNYDFSQIPNGRDQNGSTPASDTKSTKYSNPHTPVSPPISSHLPSSSPSSSSQPHLTSSSMQPTTPTTNIYLELSYTQKEIERLRAKIDKYKERRQREDNLAMENQQLKYHVEMLMSENNNLRNIWKNMEIRVEESSSQERQLNDVVAMLKDSHR